MPVVADGLRLPFQDDSFSLVTCCQVIEHIDFSNHPQLLSEATRVVKLGGQVVIATANKNYPWNVKGHRTHIAEFDYNGFQSLVESCGEYGYTDPYVIVPFPRCIEAQAKRAKFWMFRSIKDLIPRSVSEVFLSVMTGGKIHADLDMREDFQVKKFEDLKPGELFTDFLISITKKLNYVPT